MVSISPFNSKNKNKKEAISFYYFHLNGKERISFSISFISFMFYYVFISQNKPEPLDDDIEIGNIIGYNLIIIVVQKSDSSRCSKIEFADLRYI